MRNRKASRPISCTILKRRNDIAPCGSPRSRLAVREDWRVNRNLMGFANGKFGSTTKVKPSNLVMLGRIENAPTGFSANSLPRKAVRSMEQVGIGNRKAGPS
jgi:hypothetical protein